MVPRTSLFEWNVIQMQPGAPRLTTWAILNQNMTKFHSSEVSQGSLINWLNWIWMQPGAFELIIRLMLNWKLYPRRHQTRIWQQEGGTTSIFKSKGAKDRCHWVTCPGSLVLGHLPWVTCSRITCSTLGSDNFQGGHPMGSLVTLRVERPWDHWAGSLDGLTGNFEVGEPMGSLGGITGRHDW